MLTTQDAKKLDELRKVIEVAVGLTLMSETPENAAKIIGQHVVDMVLSLSVEASKDLDLHKQRIRDLETEVIGLKSDVLQAERAYETIKRQAAHPMNPMDDQDIADRVDAIIREKLDKMPAEREI